MRWWLVVTAALAAVVVLSMGSSRAVVAQTDCSGVGPAEDYSIVTFSLVSISNSDTEGRILAGVNAKFQSYQFGAGLPLDRNRIDLAVGRDLDGDEHRAQPGQRDLRPHAERQPDARTSQGGAAVRRRALFNGLAIRSYGVGRAGTTARSRAAHRLRWPADLQWFGPDAQRLRS